MKPVLILVYALLFLSQLMTVPRAAGEMEAFDAEKERELREVRAFMAKASARIREASTLRARDLLLLAPDVSLSRRSPHDEAPSAETYLSVSFRVGNLFQIEERRRGRAAELGKAEIAARSALFRMEKLLEKKFLYRKRVWKLEMIRRSTEGSLEAAELDGKIDRERVLFHDACIDIERERAGVDSMLEELGK